jgi:hypothetical protein
MGKRFSRLNQALEWITTPEGIVDLPETAPLYKYKQYSTGARQRTTAEAVVQPPRGGFVRVGVLAFGDLGETLYNVKMTKRSYDALASGTEALGGAALYNHATDLTASVKSGAFKPATAVVNKLTIGSTGGGVTIRTSFFTGFEYKAYNDASYTIPFGEATTPIGEIKAQDAIIAALSALNNDTQRYLLSFEPEDFTRKD